MSVLLRPVRKGHAILAIISFICKNTEFVCILYLFLLLPTENMTDTVDQYLGVPFAAPPTGTLRFKVRF